MINSDQLVSESILKVGAVVSVEGRSIRIKVDRAKNASHLLFHGKTIKNVSVGGYLKIAKGFELIIGKIEGEYIEEESLYYNKEYRDSRDIFKRVLKVTLIGFYEGLKFKKGLKELPLVGNECYLLSNSEIGDIHEFVDNKDVPLRIGCLVFEKGMGIEIGVDSLFASHIGIFGNTGSGKSYTLAKIYNALFLKYKSKEKFKKNASFFLIDFNGEYTKGPRTGEGNFDNIIIDENEKYIYNLSTRNGGGDKYPVPLNAINDVNIWTIFLEATDKTQVPFLRRSIENSFLDDVISENTKFKVFILSIIFEITTYQDKSLDRGLIFSLLKELNSVEGLCTELDVAISELDRHLEYHSGQAKFYLKNTNAYIFSDAPAFKATITNYFNQVAFNPAGLSEIEKIRVKIIINYFTEIVRGFSNKEHLSPLIKRLSKRFDDISKVIEVKDEGNRDDSKFLAIVSLKDVNISMRKILPLLFCKFLYETHKSKNDTTKYLNLIIDEAHNILSPYSNRESEQWKDYRLETFEEIVKEGRKFGVFLTIASQRPSDISSTIISQLHNYFLHRLINNKDIEAIEKTLSYVDKVSLDSLPILSTGTCIMAGLVAQMPVLIEIDQINEKYIPSNQTIKLTDNW